MSKALKWGLGIGGLVLLLLLLWYIFKPASTSKLGNWREVKGGDISGTQYDIAREAFSTLDAAKGRAMELNAQSFLVNGAWVIYKNVKQPVSVDAAGTYSLYVKQ